MTSIEQQIPRHLQGKERINYIKKIILPSMELYPGIFRTYINFCFHNSAEKIKYKDIILKRIKANTWTIFSKHDYLPKEYLLEEWTEINNH